MTSRRERYRARAGLRSSSSKQLAIFRVKYTMVKRCIAAGCSNTYSDNVSLYKFPRDPVLRQQWVKQVQRTRAQWSGPSEHSVLCSEHFTDCCFQPDSAIAASMGLQKRRMLKPDAIPTVFERPAVQLPSSSGSCAGASGSSRKRGSSTTSPAAEDTPSQPKKRRGAYEKRERSRVSIY